MKEYIICDVSNIMRENWNINIKGVNKDGFIHYFRIFNHINRIILSAIHSYLEYVNTFINLFFHLKYLPDEILYLSNFGMILRNITKFLRIIRFY